MFSVYESNGSNNNIFLILGITGVGVTALHVAAGVMEAWQIMGCMLHNNNDNPHPRHHHVCICKLF